MYHIFDIVWCKNSQQVFTPGVIMLDTKKQLWQNGHNFFVKHFLDGSGQLSRGKWHPKREMCPFFKTSLPNYNDENLSAIFIYASSFDLRPVCSVPVKALKEETISRETPIRKKLPVKLKRLQTASAPATVKKETKQEGLSEFEKIAQRNRDLRKQQLKTLQQESVKLSSLISAPKTVVRRNYMPNPVPYSKRDEPVVTRSRNSTTPRQVISSPVGSPILKKVRRQPTMRRSMPTRWLIDPNVDVLKPEDVTQEMLDNICKNLNDKVYNKISGTSCHQCRQKTVDTKTVCRSGHCSGVRGHFCGSCLYMRYGEDAREALKNPTWKCPPCRGVCNCSICRNNEGKCATGQAYYRARAKGFDSVMHYLAEKEGDITIEDEGSEGTPASESGCSDDVAIKDDCSDDVAIKDDSSQGSDGDAVVKDYLDIKDNCKVIAVNPDRTSCNLC